MTEIFYWPQDDFTYDFHVDFAKKTFIDISGNIEDLDCTKELNFLRNMNWPFPQKVSHAHPVVYSILPITTELVKLWYQPSVLMIFHSTDNSITEVM